LQSNHIILAPTDNAFDSWFSTFECPLPEQQCFFKDQNDLIAAQITEQLTSPDVPLPDSTKAKLREVLAYHLLNVDGQGLNSQLELDSFSGNTAQMPTNLR
jgi:hypothetical protein